MTWTLAIAAITGIVAGTINAMAGGGSFFILPMLILVGGLDPALANGTIRIGIAAQTLGATLAFWRRELTPWRTVGRLLPSIATGALAGAWLVTHIPSHTLRPLFGWALLAWAMALLLRPARLLTTPTSPPRAPTWSTHLLVLLLGAYGGFIQAGVGFPLLGVLLYQLRFPILRANAVKVSLVLGYTSLALPVFIRAGQVSWPLGLALAAGMIIGGWIGVPLQVKGGSSVIRWVLLTTLVLSGASMALR